MTSDPLLEAADRLYGLSLPEFTPARDELARSLRKDERALSDAVKALRKPSVAAWVVNLLVRRDPQQVDQVLTVGAALREAQANLDASQLRELTRQRRQLTSAVTGQARSLAHEHGQKLTQGVADEVEATLTAAMIDPGAAEAVRTGLLLRSLASTGLGDSDWSSYVAVPSAAGFTPTALGEPEPPPPPDLKVVPDPDADAKKLTSAEAALHAAEAQVATATQALDAANKDVAELEARSLQVQAEIDELRRRLSTLEAEQEDVDDQLSDAVEVVESAKADVSVADAARVKAEAALAKLR